jgi:NADPH2:quinone reductase
MTEAATIPLAAITAAVGLFLPLALPAPWAPATQSTPLLIYGASSAVGAYAVQLANHSNIHPLLCVAGTSSAHVESLIDRSKGDTIVNYRHGDDAVVAGLKKAAGGAKLLYAFDAVSENGSYVNLSQVLDPGGKLTLVLPWGDYGRIPKHISRSITSGSSVHKGYDQDFGYRFYRYISRGLQNGWLKGHPHRVVPGGRGGVGQALKDLKNGMAHGFKYVFRIADTEGL